MYVYLSKKNSFCNVTCDNISVAIRILIICLKSILSMYYVLGTVPRAEDIMETKKTLPIFM